MYNIGKSEQIINKIGIDQKKGEIWNLNCKVKIINLLS